MPELQGYDVAQVCPNGHVANNATRKFPEENQDYCDKCGDKTMTACPKCQKPIQGFNWSAGGHSYHLPAFCKYCGGAFPWTQAKMQAAIDLFLEETSVSDEQKEEFAESVQAVAKDTPASQVASKRIVRLLKVVGTGTSKLIYDILKDIASEAAKKAMFPD